MSTLAVFVALGGSATATFVVTGRNVRDSSLSGRDIRDHSIQPVDLAASALTGTSGPKGSDGVTGLRGPQGEFGPVGPIGPAGATGPTGRAGVDGGTGERGADGVQGPLGIRGAGPAVTSLDVSGLAAPPGPTRTEFMSVSITTPRDGKLSVHAELGKLDGNCSASASYGFCNAHFGLFVDGSPVPGSSRNVFESRGHLIAGVRIAPIDLLIPGIAAGTHTVAFALGGLFGDPASTNQGDFETLQFSDDGELSRQLLVTAVAG